MSIKWVFMILSVFVMTGCSNLQWVDTKEEALEQRRTVDVFSESIIVQEIILNDHVFVILAPPETEGSGKNDVFAVGQIAKKNNGSQFAWYQISTHYTGMPGGGAIPIKTYFREDFWIVLNPHVEEARKQREQILAKQEDLVSEIYESEGTYFFLKSGTHIN